MTPRPAAARLVGARSVIEVELGGPTDSDSPLVCSSGGGYSPFNTAVMRANDGAEVRAAVSRLRATEDGAFVMLLDEARGRRPMALIQDDTGAFHSKCHARGAPWSKLWRDFIFKSVFVAVGEADSRWKAESMTITHPTSGPWRLETYVLVLEALGHLVDQRELSLGRILLNCIHNEDRERQYYQEAMELLNREQSQSPRPSFREFPVAEVPLSSIGATDTPGSALFRIPMETGAESSDSLEVGG